MLGAALSTAARDAVLDRLEREAFDLAVIGGGISGAGVAREAAQRGLSVALLEAEDFASGTSSRSSKLVHGGLRYLAQGEVNLVRKTALERKEIHRLAPHLAEPRWMIVPSRSWTGHLKMRTAIAAYEKLGAVSGDDLHRSWSAEDFAREEPCLDRDKMKYACVYREYLTDDAHLVLANLRSAAALGAAVLNHAPVDAIVREAGVAAGVEAACRFSGRRVRVRAKCVVNAAGPWVEPVRRLEDAGAPPLLHLTKGVHVVVPAERLPVNHMIICWTDDRRSIFVIRRGQCVYLGTTDTSYAGGYAVWPEITREDVEYLLAPLTNHFRVDPLRPEDVTAAWAGLRPLIAQAGKAPSEISRRDEVLIGPARVLTMAGGKLTGYRLMAQETVEKAAELCGLRLAPAPEYEAPLPGGDFHGELPRLAAELVAELGVSRDCAARMARLYGAEARDVARGGTQPLLPGVPILAAEVDWAVQHEAAATVEDVLYRRLRNVWYVPGAREPSVDPVAERMAALLGWDEARTRKESREAKARLAYELSFLDRSAA
jgi:glycerol-3-phosphate dehydrogenase